MPTKPFIAVGYILFANYNFDKKKLDTDSLCLGLTRTGPISLNEQGIPKSRREQMESVFFPIVKEGMLAEFKKEWVNWLVLSNEIADEKRPGLLKPEFQTNNGEIVALCPKNYHIYCRTNGNVI